MKKKHPVYIGIIFLVVLITLSKKWAKWLFANCICFYDQPTSDQKICNFKETSVRRNSQVTMNPFILSGGFIFNTVIMPLLFWGYFLVHLS